MVTMPSSTLADTERKTSFFCNCSVTLLWICWSCWSWRELFCAASAGRAMLARRNIVVKIFFFISLSLFGSVWRAAVGLRVRRVNACCQRADDGPLRPGSYLRPGLAAWRWVWLIVRRDGQPGTVSLELRFSVITGSVGDLDQSLGLAVDVLEQLAVLGVEDDRLARSRKSAIEHGGIGI